MTSLRFAVLASGGGSNLQAILDRIDDGFLSAKFVFIASNNSQSQALQRAERAGAFAYHVSAKTEGSESAVAAKFLELTEKHSVDMIVLAGYMKKVPDALLKKFKNRIVNIHPALLPSFGGAGYYGEHVHEAVIRRGCQFSGMTLHMVNEEYDAGQIILQRIVPVPSGADSKTLAALVLAKEHDSYWRVLKAFSEGDLVSTHSDNPAEAVRINPEWLKRMHFLDDIVSP